MKKNTILFITAILLLLVGTVLIINYMAKTRYSADLTSDLTPESSSQAPAFTGSGEADPPADVDAAGVNIFLNNTQEDQICEKVVPVYRVLEGMETIIKPTLESLLEGPTAEELEQGYLTNIPQGTRLLSLEFKNGVAKANFSSELNQVAGSCAVLGIRSQIEQTLTQFRTVDTVEIMVEGETEGVLQP
jgi:spore germination protein GerM